MLLLAQSEASALKPWLDLAVSYGVPLLITGLVIWLAIKYLPKLIDGSLESQRTIPAAIHGQTKAIESLTETLTVGVDLMRDVKDDSAAAREDLDQLKKAIHHGAAAGEQLLVESGRHRDSDVVIELGKMKEAVENGSRAERVVRRRQRSERDAQRRQDDSEDAGQ